MKKSQLNQDLIQAIDDEREDDVLRLLTLGADPNAVMGGKPGKGDTALIMAIKRNATPMVDALLQRGADLYLGGAYGELPGLLALEVDNPNITRLTGITDSMVRTAPPVATVMAEAARFVGNTPLAAHNASFDRKFWQAELASLGLDHAQPFVCTVLLSRRLYPRAPNHKLGTLVEHLALKREGRSHRALSDAQVTAALLSRILSDLAESHGLADVGHEVLDGLQHCARAAVPSWLQRKASTA